MWAGRWWMLVATIGIVSGCAGGGARQDLARLQSQVGLLEERVNQLERGEMSGSSTASSSEATAFADTTATGLTGAARRPSAGATPSPKISTKPSTREIQQALKNSGFYQGAIDGKIGSLTREAIKEFQRVHGLKDDGVVGKETWAKLRSYVDLSSTSPNAATALK